MTTDEGAAEARHSDESAVETRHSDEGTAGQLDADEGAAEARHAAEQVARRSYGKLIALLAARSGDVAAAEDALSDAFAAALATWPGQGCPANPEAWLLTAARRKLMDLARRESTRDALSGELQLSMESVAQEMAPEAIPDRRLALMFACAHPAIDAGIRAPLMLQVVLGLDAKAIAAAFLTAPATMGKRLVRAKEKIRQAGIPFRVPDREELPARLDAVLSAVYAAFAEGWTDPGGTDVARRELTDEAILLARMVAELLPTEPETLGLLALMLHAEARRRARRTTAGDFVPLVEQDLAQWNWSMIEEAESLLRRATASRTMGRYQVEAALQSAHVYRRRTGNANWEDVVQLYDALATLTPSPVVAVNRAVALAEWRGARCALDSLQSLGEDARLLEYQPYWAARAELLSRVGDIGDARRAYEVAIGLERDPAVRRFLQQRMSALPR